MNQDQIQGNLTQLTGKIKEQFGKLTDDDLIEIAGKRDILIGKLQERYGIGVEEAGKMADSLSAADFRR